MFKRSLSRKCMVPRGPERFPETRVCGLGSSYSFVSPLVSRQRVVLQVEMGEAGNEVQDKRLKQQVSTSESVIEGKVYL